MVSMHNRPRTALSRFKTSLERRRTPILDAVVTPTMSIALVKADPSPIMVIVHIDEYPTDEDWDACTAFQVHAINDFNCNRGFIWVPGKKTPTKTQAKRLIETMNQEISQESIRSSVVNPHCNLFTKFITETAFFFQRKSDGANGLNIKFYVEEEEALHHILLEPTSHAAKNVLVTVEYLFDMTTKAARGRKAL